MESILCTAKGQLAHHFGLNYSATIGLQFSNSFKAKLALTKLSAHWKVHSISPTLLAAEHISGNDLETVLTELASFGGDLKAISSMTNSIDTGERFNIQIFV